MKLVSLAALAAAAALSTGGALAQQRPPAAAPARPAAPPSQAVQNPFGDASGGQGPLQIDSDRLEVRDRDKQAIFSGNVVAKRGDATVRATTMTVFYDGDTAGQQQQRGPPAAGENAQQQVRRIVMAGPVLFCQRDQTARGDNAVYERTTETLVMTGNVVLTQGQNVVTGPRLVVNLRTNQAQLERDPNRPQDRIRSLLIPGQQAGQARPNTPPGPSC